MKLIAAVFALSVAVVGVAFAGEPVHREIPYSKKVSLHTPQTYTFHFSIYDAATDGTELWYEEQSVRLKNRNLSHNLGSVIAFADAGAGPLDFSEQYWIQVSYWTGKAWKVIGVRTKLAAAPYAFWGVNDAGQTSSTVAALEARVAALETLLQHFSRNGSDISVTGANLWIKSGSGTTGGAINGLGNLIVGYNELRGAGWTDERTGSHNLVVGKRQNYSSYGGLLAGQGNTTSGEYSSVISGFRNTASGHYSSVSGGHGNTASGTASSVSGGTSRSALAVGNWVAGALFQGF